MSHQAIYRKFRPLVFEDVLGQEHVTRTLKNQIMSGNLAHAYLFSGIRGTGKTSTAKIFSRAVNCLNNHDGNPCNECESCKSILEENNMDVIEMDAASNNGVDDIRELRDKVKFLPVKSRYKVYIIDEVHMLSKGAFNALLKTLEEPPEHLLFILATTEPQKIPATILSRCQRFDLKRISSIIIAENMEKICNELNIKYEEKALKLIAANSEGAMRDAQSILDRCISFNDIVDYETVVNLLGTVNYQVVTETVNAIIDKDIEKTMNLVDNILDSGKEISYFLDELIVCFRNMLIIKTTGSPDNILRISEEEALELKDLCDKITVDEMVKIIEDLSIAQSECKKALNPRVLLETKIIKMLHNVNYVNMETIIDRIEELEQKLKGNYKPSYKKQEDEKITKAEKEKPVKINKEEINKGETNKEETNKEEINKEEINKEESAQNFKENDRLENKTDEEIYNEIIKDWGSILKEIRSDNAGLQAIIRESYLSYVINKKAVFEFDPKFTFHISAANQPKNKQKFKEILDRFLNENCEVEFIIKTEKTQAKPKETTIDDVYKDLKNQFGEIVEFKQED